MADYPIDSHGEHQVDLGNRFLGRKITSHMYVGVLVRFKPCYIIKKLDKIGNALADPPVQERGFCRVIATNGDIDPCGGNGKGGEEFF